MLGRLIRARIPGLQASLTFDELFRHDPFNLLEAGPTHALSGLCGRIWTVRGDFAVLSDPAQFRTWGVPGTVRALFASWTEPTETGAALVSEVRIDAVDSRAARYVRALEPFIGAFQGLVGALCSGCEPAFGDHADQTWPSPLAEKVSPRAAPPLSG